MPRLEANEAGATAPVPADPAESGYPASTVDRVPMPGRAVPELWAAELRPVAGADPGHEGR